MVETDIGFFVRNGSGNYPANPENLATAVLDSSNGNFYVYHTSGGWVQLNQAGIQNNLVATTNPSVGNDNTQGYSVGSIWLNTSGMGTWYFALSVATGAASWVVIQTGSLPSSAGFMLAADFTPNCVSAAYIPTFSGSSLSATFPSNGFAYVAGSRVTLPSGAHTYSANSWTYQFAESNGTVVSYTQSPSTGPPSDPGVLFLLVETNGSGVTSHTTYNTVAPATFESLMITIPSGAGQVLQSSGSGNGLLYGLVEPTSLDLSGLGHGAVQWDGTTLTGAKLPPATIAQDSAVEYQAMAWNGSAWAPTTAPLGLSVSTASTIPLGAGSPSVQSLDTTGGNIVVNLDQANTMPGQWFIIANTATSGSNTVLVNLFAGDATVGTANLTLTFGQILGIISDGTTNRICFVSK